MTRRWITDLILVGPAALAVVLFIFLPVCVVFVLAFTDYQFGAKTANWSGLASLSRSG